MKPSAIFDRLLLYKNIKIILLIVYPILCLIIYLNWSDLDNLWFDNLMKIHQKFEEPTSIILIFCYWFYSFYGVFFLFSPLLLLDKKYENNDKIKLNINKESLSKSVKNTLLFIVFPILSLIGGIIFVGFLYVANIVVSIWAFLGLIAIAIIILCSLIFYIYKGLKKIL